MEVLDKTEAVEGALKESGSGISSVSLAALPRYRSFLKISLDRPLQVFFIITVMRLSC